MATKASIEPDVCHAWGQSGQEKKKRKGAEKKERALQREKIECSDTLLYNYTVFEQIRPYSHHVWLNQSSW